MTAEQRTLIRNAINQHKRSTLDAYRRARPGNFCNGCGGHLDSYSKDCKLCSNRRWRRRQRALEVEAERLRQLRRDGICRCGRDMKHAEPVAKKDCCRCWDRQRFRRKNGGETRQTRKVQ